jgi:hypothetical protein
MVFMIIAHQVINVIYKATHGQAKHA